MIIHNATIHSPIERFATALHIEGGVISWMGDDDTAHVRARTHPDATVLDAGQALVTPTFLDSAAPAGTDARELHGQGVSAAHVHACSPAQVQELREREVDAVGIYADDLPAEPSIHFLDSGASAAQLRRFLELPRSTEHHPGVSIASASDVTAFTEAATTGRIGRVRVYVDGGCVIDPGVLAGADVVVLLTGEIRLPLADLAQAGIPFALRGEATPWHTITRALFEGPGPISARAAFTAHTRGAWRLTPGQIEPRGVLGIGAAADLAFWRAEALAVQAPDVRLAHWSTDERAGTPLLPALGEGETAPHLTELFRSGRRLGVDR